MADKYFGIVARSATETLKIKTRAFDEKAAGRMLAAISRVDTSRARAEALRAQAKAAKWRAYALVAATTVTPIGLGVAA